MPKFNIDLDELLAGQEIIRLNLGCGAERRSGYIGIDQFDLPGVDIVANLEEGLSFLPSESVDEIYSKSFLEHVVNFESLMKECWRVLKKNGSMELFVPHFSNPYYYSDYTHKRFFGLYTFEYFSKKQEFFKRKLPSFYTDFYFRTKKIKLIFTSPFFSRKVIKKLGDIVFNLSPGVQEFYEENLCYLFPCYGLQISLEPDKLPENDFDKPV